MKFIDKYNEVKKGFDPQNLCSIERPKGKIIWPKGTGVYVVWKIDGKEEAVLYIGMTGKFKRQDDGVRFNNSDFKSRATRWTPYRFCENEESGKFLWHFRYGPKVKNVQEQNNIKYQNDAYQSAVAYKNLRVDCFIVNEDHPTYSPALLEAELLTAYLKERGDLPPANNEL